MKPAADPPAKGARNHPAVDSLRQEIGQLQHELRRVRDGLERNPTRELQVRARQLRDNIALCEQDLARELNRAADRRDGG